MDRDKQQVIYLLSLTNLFSQIFRGAADTTRAVTDLHLQAIFNFLKQSIF